MRGALTAPVRSGPDASLRPPPWRRMAWVPWRQHRFALAGVALLLGGLTVWLWIVGLPLHRADVAATACPPTGPLACRSLINRFTGMDKALRDGYRLRVVP